MRNIGKNAAVTARTRELKFRRSLHEIPNYPNRGSKGLNLSTGNTYERSENGQKFKYAPGGTVNAGNEWLGSESKDQDRNMPWQGTYGPNGQRVRKGGKKRNNKTRKNKRS
jgi:hypothetical protein